MPARLSVFSFRRWEKTALIKKAARLIGKFTLRLIALFAIFLVLGVSVAAVTLKILFTPERLKSVLTDQLQQVFERPVQMDSVAVIFFRGVRVRGLKILEDPDLPSRYFIASDLVTAKLKLLPLIRKKIIFSEVNLIGPRIEIVRRADGAWNFSDIAAFSRHGEKGIPLIALTVNRAQVRDGTLLYEDIPLGLKHVVSGFNLRVTGYGIWGEFPFEVSFLSKNNIQGRQVNARFAVEGSADLAGLNWEQAYLRDGDVRATIQNKYVEGRFFIKNFVRPRVSLSLDFPAVNSRDFSPFFRVPSGIRLPPIGWDLSLDTSYFPRLQFATGLKMRSFRIQGTGVVGVSSSVPVVQAGFVGNVSALQDFSGIWTGWDSHRLVGAVHARISVAGPLNDLSLRRVYGSISNGGGTWKASQASGMDFIFSGADDFHQASCRISRGSVHVGDQTFSDIRATADLSQERLGVKGIQAVWNGSPLKGSVEVQSLFSSHRRAALNLSLGRLNLEKTIRLVSSLNASPPRQVPIRRERLWWLRRFKRSLPRDWPSLSGQLEVGKVTHPYFTGDHFTASWNLGGVSPGLKKLNGAIRVDWGPGIVRDVPHLSEQDKVLKVVFMPFMTLERMDRMGVLNLKDMRDLPYRRIHGEYRFKSGVMQVRLFYIDAADILALSQGDVDWVSEKLSLHVRTRVNKTSGMGGYSETLTDEKGRPTIGFFISGPMAKPSLMLDFKKVPEGGLEKIIRDNTSGVGAVK